MPDRQTVSFAVTAGGPAPRVRALLERVRPHVDELVLAVDNGGDADVLDACADLADRRLSFELRDSPARLIGWVQNQCAGDWILRLDDDEVPSDALLAALPRLTADPHALAFHLRRQWVHPNPDRRIARRPWSIDYQESRLVRNLPGTWIFDGAVHTACSVQGEQRFVDVPIYHCDLLLTTPGARRGKRVRYESEWPGLAIGDLRANDMYLPEEVPELESAPVPPGDAAAIRAVIEGSSPATRPSNGISVEEVAFDEIDRFNVRRLPTTEGFAAGVEIVDPPARVRTAAIHHVIVSVANAGSEPWLWVPRLDPQANRRPAPPPGWAPVRVEYRWRDPTGRRSPYRGWARLSEAIQPGETSRVPTDLHVPAEPGQWDLTVSLERGGHAFGGASYRVQVEEAPPRSPPSAMPAELAAMHQRLVRERARAERAEEEAETLTGLRRHRLGAWLTGWQRARRRSAVT